jgi:hypothetical protein
MRIEGCNYDSVELAAKFISLAEKFHSYGKENPHKVNFASGSVIQNECGTVACHGVFADIILYYQEEKHLARYWRGALKLSRFLGFDFPHDFLHWATRNPHLWGNKLGRYMFRSEGYLSFGKSSKEEEVSLFTIAEHYLGVAERLLELPLWDF